MYTSYFSKSAKSPNAISIARRAPADFEGAEYRFLVPRFWFFVKYQKDGDESFFIEQYQKEVLTPLDPEKIYKNLGEESILLCWEKPREFCHRRLVANWFEKNLGVKVPEL
jgi:hypothetical protein